MIEQYTIRELLSKYTLFIPEIQRDYVWGDENNCYRVILPFLSSLDANLQNGHGYNIGFLYSYTNDKEANYIIDGQQRFTTVVLLLYVLSVRENKDFDKLIGTASSTMRFSYNVRPQTELFLRELFRSKVVTKEDIQEEKWFLKEYYNDITIRSMVNAVDVINKTSFANIDFDTVLDYVSFWYFNVDETSQGEELYITMNSRGQKLTDSEQIKPYLFEKLDKQTDDKTDYGKEWDVWEEMFYEKKGSSSISAVDNAMNSFLRIVLEMETCSEYNRHLPHRPEELTLPLIKRYMTAMTTAIKGLADDKWANLVSDDTSYHRHLILKALIAEGLKSKRYDGDAERVKSIFTNIVDRRGYRFKHIDVLKFLSAYSKSEMSFYDFILNEESSVNVFDEHELSKIRIYKYFESEKDLQAKVESAFRNAESRNVWSGNISPLIIWASDDNCTESEFRLDVFQNYLDKFDRILGNDKLKNQTKLDFVRRALLTRELSGYPRIFYGYTNYSFAYGAEDWQTLFLDKENIPKLKKFFDEYEDDNSLQNMINAYPVEKDYSEFVHIPELLSFCEYKNVQWLYDNCWYLIAKERSSNSANIHSYKYYLRHRDSIMFEGWTKMDFYPHYSTCCFIDQESQDKQRIAIDCYWSGGRNNNQMVIEVHIRNDVEKGEMNPRLRPLIENSEFIKSGSRCALFMNTPSDEVESFELMDRRLKETIDLIKELNIH